MRHGSCISQQHSIETHSFRCLVLVRLGCKQPKANGAAALTLRNSEPRALEFGGKTASLDPDAWGAKQRALPDQGVAF